MSEKILTVAVPSYNASEYLLETIPTMADVPNAEKLEIIIVNDGSKDNTLEIANQLVKRYPSVVKVLDKENGGHGSTINASIPVATGKYYKVIDADDWVVTENFSKLLDYLETCTDDEVISSYYKVYMDTNQKELVDFKIKQDLQRYSYDDFLTQMNRIPAMHSKTTKTKLLKDNQIKLDENCFYVDMEFITFTIPFVNTISYFNEPIYCYRLGTATQSVNINNFIKNEKMHERVLLRLIDFYNDNPTMSDVEKYYFAKLIKRIIATHYNLLFAKPKMIQSKKQLLELEKTIGQKNELFVNESFGKKNTLLRKSNYLLFYPISMFVKSKYFFKNKLIK